MMMRILVTAIALGNLASSSLSREAVLLKRNTEFCTIFLTETTSVCQDVHFNFLRSRNSEASRAEPSGNDPKVLEEAFEALSVMQNNYFEAVNGTWPTSIDWTGAVVETMLSGMLATLTKSLDTAVKDHDWKQKENLIASIFAQVTHSFYGQNAVGILDEAYDDVLWVVLGWLEAIKFTRLHASLHYPGTEHDCLDVPVSLGAALQSMSWQGYNWMCTFANRARAFWDFASNGWDTKLCHGGMIWNPKLLPYKNAITNELWIAASISMYEYFPDDQFKQSWAASKGFPTKDPVYLAAAIEGYKWLKDVKMMNQQGLYVDGYHVDMSKPGNVECDQRDEVVYTYNQGVILTGQRGLFTVTGSPSYLDDGHKLIRSVINATGWNLRKNTPTDKIKKGQLPPWRGLGRGGIMEEQCDASGTCSQDGQTFKGIFFHHFTAFCAPILPSDLAPGAKVDSNAFQKVRIAHDDTCAAYIKWVGHNVESARGTRDSKGRFGMWWGAGIFDYVEPSARTDGINHSAPNVTDYRNKGTPQDSTWGLNATWEPGTRSPVAPCEDLSLKPDASHRIGLPADAGMNMASMLSQQLRRAADPNDRGRGRTVETQAGGMALLRAYWELSQSK